MLEHLVSKHQVTENDLFPPLGLKYTKKPNYILVKLYTQN